MAWAKVPLRQKGASYWENFAAKVPVQIVTIISAIIVIIVMCMSGLFCYTRLFSNSPFCVLCSKNSELLKLAGTRHGETNVDIHPFLILNMEMPSFCVIITIVCTNYPNVMIIVCTNYYYASNSVCKLCFYSIVNDVLKERKNKCHYLKGKKNSNVCILIWC